jgi:alkanesulfonate monooxygenase SsuD/methylene tetrahydromethanopterin reductase-like flavin-dependent oxidoreductase (luciferase family)
MPMRVGIALPQYRIDVGSGKPWRGTLETAVAAERLGLDSVWLSDHPFAVGPDGVRSGAVEPLTSMAALTRHTARVRIGSLVLASTMRAPAIMAHTFATLGRSAPGRVVAGLGAGWYEAEHRAFGLPLPPYAARLAQLDIAARAVAGLPEPRPAVLVGGAGPGVIDLAARVADAWNVAWDPPAASFAGLARALDDACGRAGRDPRSVERSVGVTVAVGAGDRALDAAVERLRSRARFLADVERIALEERIVLGTPERCVERLAAYHADEVVVALLLRDDLEMLELFATEVAPFLRDA